MNKKYLKVSAHVMVLFTHAHEKKFTERFQIHETNPTFKKWNVDD